MPSAERPEPSLAHLLAMIEELRDESASLAPVIEHLHRVDHLDPGVIERAVTGATLLGEALTSALTVVLEEAGLVEVDLSRPAPTGTPDTPSPDAAGGRRRRGVRIVVHDDDPPSATTFEEHR